MKTISVICEFGLAVWFVVSSSANGQQPDHVNSYNLQRDIPYRSDSNQTPYMLDRCKLDIYYPTNQASFPTIVWFHGGGLRSGNKSIPEELMKQGVAVVAANYRLHPKVHAPAYIEDAAASVAWAVNNIKQFGGDPTKVFVSGHSAGGYLTSMVGMDRSYLAAHQVDANKLAGLIPFSGHAITHFTVRAEHGIDDKQPIIDKMAPLFHVRKDCAPMLIITGDRELEMLGRYEENAYLYRMMQVVGHPATAIQEIDDSDHSAMVKPAFNLLLKFVKKHSHRKTLELSTADEEK